MRATAHERRTVLKLFNIAEAARQLGVGFQRFYRDVRAGRVQSPQVRIGRRCYFTEADLSDLSTHYKKGLGTNIVLRRNAEGEPDWEA